MNRQMLRMAGPIVGVALALAAFRFFEGLTGLVFGGAIFIAGAALSERYWRAGAVLDEVKKDLEDRVRNPPS